MPDAITFEPKRIGNVMPDQLKPGMTEPLGDIAFASREIVIKTDHLLPGLHQAINQMGADKTSPSSHQIDQRSMSVYE